jgi:hypothetical protein
VQGNYAKGIGKSVNVVIVKDLKVGDELNIWYGNQYNSRMRQRIKVAFKIYFFISNN